MCWWCYNIESIIDTGKEKQVIRHIADNLANSSDTDESGEG